MQCPICGSSGCTDVTCKTVNMDIVSDLGRMLTLSEHTAILKLIDDLNSIYLDRRSTLRDFQLNQEKEFLADLCCQVRGFLKRRGILLIVDSGLFLLYLVHSFLDQEWWRGKIRTYRMISNQWLEVARQMADQEVSNYASYVASKMTSLSTQEI